MVVHKLAPHRKGLVQSSENTNKGVFMEFSPSPERLNRGGYPTREIRGFSRPNGREHVLRIAASSEIMEAVSERIRVPNVNIRLPAKPLRKFT